MDRPANHSDWDRIAAIVAATWLFAVGAQAVVHLIRYQMHAPPDWAWRLDFTPVYLPLVAITAVVLVLRRFAQATESRAKRDQR